MERGHKRDGVVKKHGIHKMCNERERNERRIIEGAIFGVIGHVTSYIKDVDCCTWSLT